MRFKVGCQLDYQVSQPATFLFVLKCLETGGQRIARESLIVEPRIDQEEFTIGVGMNRFTRLMANQAGLLRIHYQAEVSISTQIVRVGELRPDGPGRLIPEAIPYLFPSRYCQSDQLRQEAYDIFGNLPTSHAVAAGIADWIHAHVRYESGASNEESSALETFREGRGVCRDFAHLGIAFCRAMSIPARYLTCYAHQLEPPDFHACFEAFIDDLWYVFDATRLAPLNGLVRIATGRDAADAAVCTIYGDILSTGLRVTAECLDAGFVPVTSESLHARDEAIALL